MIHKKTKAAYPLIMVIVAVVLIGERSIGNKTEEKLAETDRTGCDIGERSSR